MRRWTIFVAVAALSSATLVGSLAPGSEHPRVLLVGPSEDHPIVERLTEELRVLGLDIAFTVGARGIARLSDLARDHHADAAARVEKHPDAIVLWVDPDRSPPGEGAAAGAEIRLDETITGSKDTGLLALRAIEVLRGRLLPVEYPPSMVASTASGDASSAAGEGTGGGARLDASPPHSPLPPQSTASTPAEAEGAHAALIAQSAFSAFAGPCIALSPGGVPASLDVALGARWAPRRPVELELTGILPVTAPSVDGAEGTIDLRAYVVAGGVGAVLAPASSRAFGSGSLGLGAMRLIAHGNATSPFRSADSGGWAALPYARVGGGYALSPSLALRADALLGVARPGPVLRMAGDEVGVFGNPFILFGLSVEMRP